MPDLLLEFFSEEIPARMQARAAEDLRKAVTDRLVAAGLTYEGAKAFATPRRLALTVQGVPVRQPDIKDEKKGPRVGAPEQAIAGFLKAAGLTSIGEAKVQPDKKGDFYVASIEKTGRPAIEVIAEIVPEVVKAFPWPKSMRWGSGSLNWVRPLHSIVATFGPETEEPDIVPFTVDGVTVGDTTRGHRFMAPAPIKVRRFNDYVKQLEQAKVVLDPARRAQMILADAKNLAFAQGYELVEDEGLLAEVAGLVEWPVALMGSFDAEFLKIPQEVIRATIRNNQKCFVLRTLSSPPSGGGRSASEASREGVSGAAQSEDSPHPGAAAPRRPSPSRGGLEQAGALANKFIMVANIEANDGGKAIVAGCERVIRARLSDAKFFYETDLKTRLEDRLPKFEGIVFHEKLGTQAGRIARIQALAGHLAPIIGADVAKAERAAQLCKADLLTDVVGEFPELQGLMGKYYALAQGEDKGVAAASEEHYKPVGPGDRVPTDPVSVAVALADKLDILAGFWTVDEKPTGSKDPYALRRAALGVIRIVLDNQIRLALGNQFAYTLGLMAAFLEHHQAKRIENLRTKISSDLKSDAIDDVIRSYSAGFKEGAMERFRAQAGHLIHDLTSFFADRLKVQLREQGARHDLVDAVFALEGQDDLLLVVRRVEALGKFLDTDDGKNLLAGTKRAANILRIEEKKDSKSYTGAPDAKLYALPEEKELARAIGVAKADAAAAVAKEDFAAAMSAMAKLRPHVDAFFDKVTVNVTDSADAKALRENRLKLLNEIREATRAVADFSKIEG